MGLLSIFRRRVDAPSQAAPVSESADAVQKVRTRARQRLIGAVVLLGIGIVGFPLVFETQPRPIPVDIPIEIPRKEGGPPLVMPPARGPAAASGAERVTAPPAPPAPSAVVAPDLTTSPRDAVITETREEAGRELPAASRPADASVPHAASVPSTHPAMPPAVAAAVPKAAQPRPPASQADAARAKALLEGKEAPATAGRFVVQVGAFADAAAAREVRLKVEKLGMKTYTQVAETPSGSRIRVRVGPFATRADADKAQARARSAGLQAAVLTL